MMGNRLARVSGQARRLLLTAVLRAPPQRWAKYNSWAWLIAAGSNFHRFLYIIYWIVVEHYCQTRCLRRIQFISLLHFILLLGIVFTS